MPSIIRVKSEHSMGESTSGREGIAMQGLSYLQREVRLFKPRKVVHDVATMPQVYSQSVPACRQGTALTPGNIAAHLQCSPPSSTSTELLSSQSIGCNAPCSSRVSILACTSNRNPV